MKTALDLDLEKDIILGDSGGFQLSTGAVKYSEEIVETFFTWLENNTNWAMNLDFPPYIKRFTGERLNFDEDAYFKEKLEASVKHFKYFKDHASGKTKFMNVIHGRNHKELNAWYEVIKDFNFEGGWGVGSLSTRSTNDIYLILLVFFYLYEKGEMNKKYNDILTLLHFLGFTNIFRMPVVLYLQNQLNVRDINITLSFDSSSYGFSAGLGKYASVISNYGIKNVTFSNTWLGNKQIQTDVPLPCNCPVCNKMKLSNLFQYAKDDGFKTEFYMYLTAHNLYKLIEYKKNVESIMLYNCKEMQDEYFDAKNVKLFRFIDGAFNADKPSQYIHANRAEICKLAETEITEPAESIKKFF